MRTLSFLVILSICCASPAWGWRARVIDIIDGDTVLVRNPDETTETVELYGLDAPKGEYAEEARKFTAALLYTENVEVEPIMEDESGTVHGLFFMIYKANRFANEEIIEAGYARVDDSCRESFCESWKSMEQAAQKARRGMWADWQPTPAWKK